MLVNKNFPVIDGHNDLAWASRVEYDYRTDGLDGAVDKFQTDTARMRRGNMVGQFWSVWIDPVLEGAEQVTGTLEQIDFVQRLIAMFPNELQAATTEREVRDAIDKNKIASLIGVEGGAQINNSLAVLRQYAKLGARYMTLTWSRTIDWADSATDEAKHNGLTTFGKEVVREMNRVGMMIDLAHVSPSTMRDALDVSELPVLVSHSGASEVCGHPRNVPDDVLERIGQGGGTVMATFVPSFLTQERYEWAEADEKGAPPPVTVHDAADHLDHIREVAGIDAVGIGSDYDGAGDMPSGLEDVASFPNLFEELGRRGWSESDLIKLGTENVLRVLRANDSNYEDFISGAYSPAKPELFRPSVDTNARGGNF
jgi:membrane dipeptidase